MKSILVPVADRPECVFALDSAFRLAKSLGASVAGCHVRPHREDKSGSNGNRLMEALESIGLDDVPEDVASLNSRKASELFARVAAKHAVVMARKRRLSAETLAYWQEMVGTPDRLLGIVGPVSDLVVVSRPKKKSSGPARAFLLAALLNSGRPVLVLPQKSVKPGKRVCIAWNCSVSSARAVSAAMPVLQLAESVHIVSCGKNSTPGPSISHLKGYLAMWGVDASSEITRGRNDSKELLEQYQKSDSDLLVMGAYSRSHFRERILGGVTHAMLNESAVNLFALHS
ncbi:MAG: universal stress protein [Xanthomonadales bacterium]|nr:universal stress protein [Xanthomonadales bacterium]